MEESPLSDEELAGLAANGDRRAFARLYERHLPGLYDFVVRVVWDRGIATALLKAASVEARAGLRDGRARGSPKAWLYATAHRTALDALLAQTSALAEDPSISFAVPGSEGEAVWNAAAGLPPQDYALLDLNVRRGLGADELADSLGVAHGPLAGRLALLREELGARTAGAAGIDASRAAGILAQLEPVEPPGPRFRRRPPAPRRPTPRRPVPRRPVLAAGAAVLVVVTTGAVLAARGGGVDDPADLASRSHRIGVAGENVVAVAWSRQPDARGYSVLWTRTEQGLPDETVDLPGSATSARSPTLAAGSWWFVLRTRGGGDDWSGGIRLGPFVVPPAPAAEIAARPPAASSSRRAAFRFTAAESGARFECALDGAAYEPCASSSRYRRLKEGRHRLAVRATGVSGAAGEPAVYEWTVDTRAPKTRFTDKPPSATRAESARLRFAASEPGVRFECKLDRSPWHDCGSPQSLANLTEEPHRFAVRARDRAGNVDRTPAVSEWRVDRTPPDTQIGAGAGRTGRTASFDLVATESEVSFRCSLDGAAFAGCSSPLVLSGLRAGRHTLRVLARDEAGNTDATPAEHTWTVDSRAPGTLLVQHPPPVTRRRMATFAFAATEEGATFQCSLDGRAFTSCSSPITYIGLTPGNHVFAVRARDRARNVDRTPVTWRWRVR